MRIQAGGAARRGIHSFGIGCKGNSNYVERGTKPKTHAPWSTLNQGEASTYGEIAPNTH